MNGTIPAVYRVRAAQLDAQARRHGRLATVALVLAALLLFVGLPLGAFGIVAVVIHDTRGDVKEIVAAILVLVPCFTPLAFGALASLLGIRWVRRASRLRELRTLTFGREVVSSTELAARTRRTETEMRALLAMAEQQGAAWRTP